MLKIMTDTVTVTVTICFSCLLGMMWSEMTRHGTVPSARLNRWLAALVRVGGGLRSEVKGRRISDRLKNNNT